MNEQHLPQPSVEKSGGPKEVFANILMMVALYASAIGLLTLFFQYINIGFPDQLEDGYGASSRAFDAIRRAMSVVVVMFGVYLFLSRNRERAYRTNPELRGMKSRKWLVHMTLFASAMTLMIDVIVLIYRLMNGDLTLRIGLKILAILVVAGSVFAYYSWDSRRSVPTSAERTQGNPGASGRLNVVAGMAGLVVIASVVAGFFIVGSPAEQRKRRFDEQRVNDLSMIQSEIIAYWQRKRELPQSLEDLKNDMTGFRAPVDPRTGVEYGYFVTGPLGFQLCARFETETRGARGDAKTRFPSYPPPGPYDQGWNHGRGDSCFDRVIDPSWYPNAVEEPIGIKR